MTLSAGRLGDGVATTAPEPGRAHDEQAPGQTKRRNPWIWVSVLLGLVAPGLLIWALSAQSDLDSTQKQVDDLQAEVDQGQSAGSKVIATTQDLVDDMTPQLGATTEDLDETEQDLADAERVRG